MPEQEAGGETDFKPKMAQMQSAMLIIGFIGYCLLGWIWGGSGMYNTFFAWGGWLWLIFLFILLYGSKVIENRSPKFVSLVVGTTIATPDPIVTTEPQGGWPAMGLFALRTVKGLGIIEFAMSCRAYAWVPLDLAYKIGHEEKGVNVFANAHLKRLKEHSELAPHLLDATRLIRKPPYNPDMTVYVSMYPLLINELTPEQHEACKKELEAIGIPRDLYELVNGKGGIRGIMERYAAKLSKFRYGPEFTKPDMLQNVIKSQASQIDALRDEIDTWKSDVSALHDLSKYGKEPRQEPGFFDRLPGGNRQERPPQNNQDQEEGRRY